MFKICNFLEKNISLHDHWSMMNGLEIMINLLENYEKLYIDVITEYFNANTPFKLNGYQQVGKMLEYIGYEKTYKLLNTKDYLSKNIWLSLIWECISEKNITESITNDFKIFTINNLEKTNPIIPNIHMLSIYGKKDKELKTKVIKKLVSIPKLSYNFLENVFYENSGECFILTGEQELFHIGEDLYEKEEKGYIFDNAISYLSENKIENKEIIFSTEHKGDYSVIKCKNKIIDSVLSKNPLLHTDKADKKNHGKGISIVKSIAQKYGGDVVISEKNNEFIVSVVLDNRIFT